MAIPTRRGRKNFVNHIQKNNPSAQHKTYNLNPSDQYKSCHLNPHLPHHNNSIQTPPLSVTLALYFTPFHSQTLFPISFGNQRTNATTIIIRDNYEKKNEVGRK